MYDTCDCGLPLIETMPATRYSPAEWECPVCDGGLTPDELSRMQDAHEDYEWRLDIQRENDREWLDQQAPTHTNPED